MAGSGQAGARTMVRRHPPQRSGKTTVLDIGTTAVGRIVTILTAGSGKDTTLRYPVNDAVGNTRKSTVVISWAIWEYRLVDLNNELVRLQQ